MKLSDRIRDYIAKNTISGTTYITKEQIMAAAKGKGFSVDEILTALSEVHTLKDIKVGVKNGTTTYRLRPIREAKPTLGLAVPYPVIDFDPLDGAFFTEEERACLRRPKKEWDDRCHEICDTPADYHLYMERK